MPNLKLLRPISWIPVVLFSLFLLSNCIEEGSDPEPGANGFNALVDVTDVDPGETCENGGVQISVGQDLNENGQLDSDEIMSSSFVCNGSNSTGGGSASILTNTSAEQPGDNCANGGTLIEIGIDTNENGELESTEVQSSFFVCNGEDEVQGSTSLMRATAEEPGDNCSNGGMKIEIGLDTNGDLVLSTEEVESTFYMCGGTDGLNSLVRVDTESPGDNCTNGGLAIHVGLDSDGNGTLEDDETIGEPQYICADATGTDGMSPIVVSNTDITSCPNGGTELTFGYDLNEDGSLIEADGDVILETVVICDGSDGTDGYNTIIVATDDSECSNGGKLIKIGLDANGNNNIDEPDELQSSFEICNGLDGSNGLTSLIKTTVLSKGDENCPEGGTMIQVGIDTNQDGILDTDEIDDTQTTYICNGANGTSDTIFEFYFTQGVDGYNGAIEAVINNYSGEMPSELLEYKGLLAGKGPGGAGQTFRSMVAIEPEYFISLLRFEGLESIAETVSGDYHIVDARLFIYADASQYAGGEYEVIIDHLNQPSDNGLFQNDATWDFRTSDLPWEKNGTFTFDETNGINSGSAISSYSTGDQLLPMLVDRSTLHQWIEGQNHGLALSLSNYYSEGMEYVLINGSTDENIYKRPTLYIKVQKTSSAARTVENTDDQLWWQSLSYEEKIAPFVNR